MAPGVLLNDLNVLWEKVSLSVDQSNRLGPQSILMNLLSSCQAIVILRSRDVEFSKKTIQMIVEVRR